jgi:glycosyltransferase involved in cell wall biosynthesis
VLPLGWILSRRLRRPHAWHLREFIDLDFGYATTLGVAWTRRIFRTAETTISVSQAVQRHLLPRPRARDIVIYEGIGPRARLQARTEAGRAYPVVEDVRGFQFVLVGMLQVNKGQDLAVRALAVARARAGNAHLTLVGGGDQTSLRSLASSLGIDEHVTFTGHLSDPMPVVLKAHASLMLSRAEAFGRTTVEAMSLGRPVIALQRGATPEIIQHESTGLLCESEPDALADAMIRLMQNPAWAADIGHRAAAASLRYTDEAYADGMEAIFLQKPF